MRQLAIDGGVQGVFIPKQKNIIHNQIHIIRYSNWSTLKCSNLKYSKDA